MNYRYIIPLLILILQSSICFCNIKLPKLISDGMIMQRDIDLNIWGWADPSEEVELIFNSQPYYTKADKDGRWQIILPPQSAGGPYEMKFRGYLIKYFWVYLNSAEIQCIHLY